MLEWQNHIYSQLWWGLWLWFVVVPSSSIARASFFFSPSFPSLFKLLNMLAGKIRHFLERMVQLHKRSLSPPPWPSLFLQINSAGRTTSNPFSKGNPKHIMLPFHLCVAHYLGLSRNQKSRPQRWISQINGFDWRLIIIWFNFCWVQSKGQNVSDSIKRSTLSKIEVTSPLNSFNVDITSSDAPVVAWVSAIRLLLLLGVSKSPFSRRK